MRFNLLISLPKLLGADENLHYRPSPALEFATGRRLRDAFCVLAVLIAYAAHALLLEPNYDRRSIAELLYAAAFSVGIGALAGMALFDRYGFRRAGLFLVATIGLISMAALFHEAVVEPSLFHDGPINAEGLYYSVTDLCTATLIFLILRLLQLLRQPAEPDAALAPASGEAECFFVRIASQTRRIFAADVLYMKAERDFTYVVCEHDTYFVSESLKHLLAKSSVLGMTRVHKSFAVNLRRLDRLTGAGAEVGGLNVPVGRTFRATLAAAWTGETRASEGRGVAYG